MVIYKTHEREKSLAKSSAAMIFFAVTAMCDCGVRLRLNHAEAMT
jgi:hypothetical protein